MNTEYDRLTRRRGQPVLIDYASEAQDIFAAIAASFTEIDEEMESPDTDWAMAMELAADLVNNATKFITTAKKALEEEKMSARRIHPQHQTNE